MRKLLFVKASPRDERSHSISIANEYLSEYRKANPGAKIETIELWKEKLPEFDGDASAAKVSFFGEPEMNQRQKTVYEELISVFDKFNSFDDYLFAVPMWNFGVPYKLKQYIDVLTMPQTLFGFDPKVGYIGLLKNKKATVIYSAAIYMPGLPKSYGTDHVSTHFEDWLRFAGIDDITSIRFWGNKMSTDIAPLLARAKDTARSAAQSTGEPAKSHSAVHEIYPNLV